MEDNGENDQKKFFSVILISYRHDDFVLDTLKSIKFQSYDPSKFELIIICKSDNNLKTIIDQLSFKCHVRLLINDDFRIGQKFLEALKMTRSKWIVVLDDDDMWIPEKLDTLNELISQYPKAVYIHNDKYVVNEQFHYTYNSLHQIKKTNRFSPTSGDSIIRNFKDNCEHNGSSIAFSKTIVCGRSNSLRILEGSLDTFLFVSAIETGGSIICIKNKLTLFRVTSKNNLNESTKRLINNLKRQMQSYEVIRNIKLTNPFTRWFIDWRILYNRLKINLIEDTTKSRQDRFEFFMESIRNKFFRSKEGFYFEFFFILQFINNGAAKYTYMLAKKILSKH